MSVSIAICTHNGENLLPCTISHLKRQSVGNDLDWEVMVIDNASTDSTARVARECWGDDGPVPMRIIHEPRLGLTHARERAFEEARHEIVSFIDDDNRVMSNWIATASECMSTDSELGALSSCNTAVAQGPFPEWFWRWAHYYAAHASCRSESATLERWILVGAGMTIRKSAWQDLKRNNFRLQLADRVGQRLSTCGDLELGCAIQLAGWKIRVEPRLKLEHFMTANRLQWRYLRNLVRATGEAMALLDAYFFFSQPETSFKHRLRRYWWAHVVREAMAIANRYSAIKAVKTIFYDLEGDDDVLFIELGIGRLVGLLRLRSQYGSLHREIARAPWRRSEPV